MPAQIMTWNEMVSKNKFLNYFIVEQDSTSLDIIILDFSGGGKKGSKRARLNRVKEIVD